MSVDEKSYYNIKRLHVVFAASSLMLLAVTVWMLVADHRRQWKGYQQTYRDKVEPWVTETRILQQQHATEEADQGQQETLRHLEQTLRSQTPGRAERLLRMPIVDALGRSLAIEQIWLPELTIDYNFCRVPRFDRCLTCHQGIDRTVAGHPSRPAFPPQRLIEVELLAAANPPGGSLEQTYGFVLASRGVIDPRAPTVGLVVGETPAAFARLAVGDVIVKIDGETVANAEDVRRRLLEARGPADGFSLLIRRGLPEPYCAHPRLDLMVGSSSPHPMSEFGCTICHDGQGSATDFRWASHSPNGAKQQADWRGRYGWSHNPHWDYPMLPARFAESRCLKCHHEVVDLEPSRRFPDAAAPKLVDGYRLVRRSGCFGCHEIKGIDQTGRSIGPDMRVAPDDVEAAEASRLGLVKKVGPNLRYAIDRMDGAFLAAWISNPAGFRPDTRMPSLFGLHEHLDNSSAARTSRLEAVEIRGIVEYLLASGEKVTPPAEPRDVTEKPSADRGRRVFRTQGCLACHQHNEFSEVKFPGVQSTQGPDLSNLGAKYTTAGGRRWLTGWIRDPAHYWPKALMPNSLLAPEPLPEETSEETSEELAELDAVVKIVDPAGDVAAFLLSFEGDYQTAKLPVVDQSSLDELLASYPDEPSSVAIDVKDKLQQVGRRAIARRGCYGCHEIPGFAGAKPIGPALSDWGRKLESLLAFEQIDRFVKGPSGQGRGADDEDRDFYLDALLSHRREGFVWQKLRQPRSFDFGTTDQKGYHERLTMGQFKFTPAEREAVITFVLGLVADPPADKYIYHPDKQRRAIIEGRKVMDKYACTQCHMLEPARWSFDFAPKHFQGPPPLETFDFVRPHFTPEQLAASKRTDDRGLGRAEVVGMPRVDDSGRWLQDEDDEGNPLYFFTLWQPAAINGEVWQVGGLELMIPKSRLISRREPVGGTFARLLHRMILADSQTATTAAPPLEAWGWVPPPLSGEGAKVRLAWLHDYLLAPNRIRPAAVLRMPRFGLSSDEAGKLADYFAATANIDFPYDSRSRKGRESADPNGIYSRRPDSNTSTRAMRILLDRKTFCAKCHSIDDYEPRGDRRTTRAPNLAGVQGRIRPEYLRRWLGDPRSILPYTVMPVNFPPTGPPLGQEVFPGTSIEQLDAVMDLLLDFDEYIRSKTSPGAAIGPTPAEKP
ncbi:MAG: hypothetical protein V3V75_00985 [Thermoguttaceae bacterium]